MKDFQLVELEGYKDKLFSASNIFPEQLYNFKGGQSLAFYNVYEFMPIMPPLEPIVRAIYEKGKYYPLDIDLTKEKVSFNLRNEGYNLNKFCHILVKDIKELIMQLDLYLLYHSIGLDLEAIKDNIMPIFRDEQKIEINNLFNNDKEKFTLILSKFESKVLFVLKKEE